ncbi:MAG: hypothetical protein MRJ67_15965 [Nitrospirales bacterium]|nr:hypothetical protein [Nitrospira sp.]MDR4461987.1 hypothetical protein [Nitrospirales bacterium]MDR4482853.1 hypothetical protein [Nitrospirales bacterium]
MMIQQSASSVNASLSVLTDESEQNGKLLHSLSNKLLPIVVFSELALRRCEDDQLKRQLEKIHGAAEQARDILLEIRSLQAVRTS